MLADLHEIQADNTTSSEEKLSSLEEIVNRIESAALTATSTTMSSTSTTPTTTTSTTTTTTKTTTTTTTTTTTASTTSWDFHKDCGVRPIREGRDREARIVGGKETQFGDWPWQVLVKESTLLGLFTKDKCGGVLISDRHVLTAAHCQPGFLASLMVELGEYDISGPHELMSTKQIKVKRVVVHKDYKAPTFENDIAVLELD